MSDETFYTSPYQLGHPYPPTARISPRSLRKNRPVEANLHPDSIIPGEVLINRSDIQTEIHAIHKRELTIATLSGVGMGGSVYMIADRFFPGSDRITLAAGVICGLALTNYILENFRTEN